MKLSLINHSNSTTRELELGSLHDFMFDNAECRPYLRSMSSMTDKERAEKIGLLWEFEGHINEDVTYKYQDWLNVHHFDYRGLIPMGLAIEVTEENNPYKN